MNAAKNWKDLSLEELQSCRAALEQDYADFVRQKLKLNMARGKPAGTQLDPELVDIFIAIPKEELEKCIPEQVKY